MIATAIAALILLGSAGSALAASADDLKFFEAEAQVVTASRREQSISESPVAIDVITAEEIHASGVQNIADLMRYQPGVNVIDAHPSAIGANNRAIVSIRGFAESFARNTLVLLDGRPVLSQESGGVYWEDLPVAIQDIERIEIIRGPNAALYGSGAGLGVINIITKKPANGTTASLDQSGGNRGTLQSYESVDSSLRGMDFRLSHVYHQQGGFDSTDEPASNDYLHSNKADFRSHWSLSPASELEVFAGGSWNNSGLSDDLGSQNRFNQHFEMARLSHQFSEDSRVEVRSSRNDFTSDVASSDPSAVTRLRNYQYDENLMHQLDWADGRMKSTYGLDYQFAKAESQTDYPGNPNAKSESVRGYFNQTAQITSQLAWVGAFSWDARSTGKPRPNYQLSQLWEPVRNQSFRLSYSVAHTIPTLRLLDIDRANGSPAIFGNPNLKPQTITSYEAGYRGDWLEHRLSAEADVFYTVVDDIDDTVFTLNPGPTINFINVNQAIARGAELQLKYRFSRRRSVYANYTYEHLTDSTGNTGEITKNTPSHALNLGGMSELGRGLSGSFNLGYKDSYFVAFQQDSALIPAYWRLDLRLGYALPWYRSAELYVAGQNLLAPRHAEYADDLLVPRTYQAGVSVKFN